MKELLVIWHKLDITLQGQIVALWFDGYISWNYRNCCCSRRRWRTASSCSPRVRVSSPRSPCQEWRDNARSPGDPSTWSVPGASPVASPWRSTTSLTSGNRRSNTWRRGWRKDKCNSETLGFRIVQYFDRIWLYQQKDFRGWKIILEMFYCFL